MHNKHCIPVPPELGAIMFLKFASLYVYCLTISRMGSEFSLSLSIYMYG